MISRATRALIVPATLAFALLLAAAQTQAPNIFDAVLAEPGQGTSEVSTAALQAMLTERSAIVLDARPWPTSCSRLGTPTSAATSSAFRSGEPWGA
jgi:hypothetical protein